MLDHVQKRTRSAICVPNVTKFKTVVISVPRKQMIAIQEKGSVLGKQTCTVGRNKAEADKCKLNAKIFVAPSIGISKNYHMEFMTL